MTSKEFVVWLQGFAELNEMGAPSESQWNMICERLNETVNSVADPTVSTKNDPAKAVDAGMWADNAVAVSTPAVIRNTRGMAVGGIAGMAGPGTITNITNTILNGPEAVLGSASASATSALSTMIAKDIEKNMAKNLSVTTGLRSN